jgi:hypothetical protein
VGGRDKRGHDARMKKRRADIAARRFLIVARGS